MALRRKVEEFEADLYKVPTPRFWRVEKGELERKKYADGEEKLEISFRGLPKNGAGSAAVLIEGERICSVALHRGRGRQVLSTANGDEVPKVSNGSVVEIELEGQVLLRGIFRPD